MIGEISYVQFALLCIFTFGCMAVIIYIVADELKAKAQWEVERSGAAEARAVSDKNNPAPSRYAHDWEGPYDDEGC